MSADSAGIDLHRPRQAGLNWSHNCVTNVWARGLSPVFIAVWRLQKSY